jgi:hypothetical protein
MNASVGSHQVDFGLPDWVNNDHDKDNKYWGNPVLRTNAGVKGTGKMCINNNIRDITAHYFSFPESEL